MADYTWMLDKPIRGFFRAHPEPETAKEPEMSEPTIPEGVIEALGEVRASGRTNMFDRKAVAHVASDLGYYVESTWIYEADGHTLMAAMNEMGRRHAAGEL